MRKIYYATAILLFSLSVHAQHYAKLSFETVINNVHIKPDSLYFNAFGEDYSISKLKYYVSNLHFVTVTKNKVAPNVYLVDISKDQSFSIPVPKGNITGIEFLLGVDSALNCSGAQSGALDPLNDMFWTWNSGYVMFKLEGISTAAKTTDNRIEYHIGGYKGKLKTMRKVFIPFPKTGAFAINDIVIKMSPEVFWNGKNRFSFSETPVIVTVSEAARKAADNFPGMFSLKE